MYKCVLLFVQMAWLYMHYSIGCMRIDCSMHNYVYNTKLKITFILVFMFYNITTFSFL